MTGFPHFSIRTGVIAAALAAAAISSAPAVGQTSTVPAGSAVATPDNAVLLTVFLKHDESRPLAELNAQLAKQGFYKAFPPPGVEVVSWTVTMGIGQIVVLRLPAARLREVNRVLEDTAWGVYRTEFYPTYDYKAIGLGGGTSGRSKGGRTVSARTRRSESICPHSGKASRHDAFVLFGWRRAGRFLPNASQVIHPMKKPPRFPV